MAQYLSNFLNTAYSTYTENDAFNDSVVYPITLTHTTTGTPANGIGTGLRFITETSNTNNEIGGLIEVVTTDVTSGSEDFDFVFKTMAAGATAAEKLRIKSTGEVDVAGNLIVSGGKVTLAASSNRDKYRLWNNNTYIIGLEDSVTYGGISTEKAMTFQMDNNSSQGFWWGDSTHTTAQGAMALTTDGKLSVAHSLRLGYGESDTTTPGATFKLDVNGNIYATGIDFGEVTIESTTGIDSWKYNGNLFSTASEDPSISEVFIDNINGFYLIAASDGSTVYKYLFNTPYKVDTLAYLDVLNVGAEELDLTSLFVKADGTKIYIVGTNSQSVHQYDLSTAWNFSTASYVDSNDISTEDTLPHGLFFKPDGTKMYMLGQQNTKIYEYNLGTAWDITSATYSQQLDISAKTPKPTSMKMSSDGNTLYVLDSIHDAINKFALSSAWNITSATYTDKVDISTITSTINITTPTGFDISTSANKVFVSCSDNVKIFEFDAVSESARVTGNRLIVDEDIHVKNNLLVYNNARIHNSLEVANDASVRGDLTVVGALTGTLTGSASSWTTARTITLGGDLTGNVSIDGSADVTLTATIGANSVALGTDTTGNYVASITNGNYITGGNGGSEGAALTLAVDATSNNTASKVVARDSSGNFSAGTITATINGTVTNGALTTGTLAQFAATTSAELAGVISDETGTGSLVFGTSPNFTTSINGGFTFTAFANSSTLTLGYDGTAASTTNISTGAVASATTKTVNLGTGGAAGSTTNINIGSSVAGTTTISSPNITISGLADTATTATHYYVETTGGNILPKTLANTRTEIVTTAAVNAAAATTVGTVTSGIWNAGAVSSTGAFTSTLTGVTTTGGGQVYLNGATSNRIDFNTNGVAIPAITTRSAGTKVVYSPAVSGVAVDYAVGIATDTLWHSVPTGSQFFRWYGGTTQAAVLTGTGTFTATADVCAYSDVRLKDNIEVIADPLNKVLKLRGVTFTRNDLDDNRTHMGVIAQEVEEVIPEVVITGEDGIKTVAYGNIVGLLIEAVKELTTQNKELSARIEQLESKK